MGNRGAGVNARNSASCKHSSFENLRSLGGISVSILPRCLLYSSTSCSQDSSESTPLPSEELIFTNVSGLKYFITFFWPFDAPSRRRCGPQGAGISADNEGGNPGRL